MKTLTEFLSGSWAQSMGWTLLHSVWQGALLLALTWVVLQMVPTSRSTARYRVAVAALMLMICASVSTFFFYYNSMSTSAVAQPAPQTGPFHTVSNLPAKTNSPAGTSVLDATQQLVQANMPIILALWMTGAFLFALRLISGWAYIHNLRRDALEIDSTWQERVRQLAAQLDITRYVTLAESARIHAPVVMGYLKPVILIPIGMIEGLSTEQLETIFIHELTHIRRHDYLVNVLQTLIEALYFFNPFVWILSGIIRREREHCCDDTVVLHSNALVYARALAHLEESRLNREGLALSLAENKHQLLNRIKRIMEKSVKNSPGRERIVPAVLLIVGLMCASWLTIQTGREQESTSNKKIAADTLKPKKSQKTITIIHENDVPIIEPLEPFQGFEPVEPLEPMEMDELEVLGTFEFDGPDFPVIAEVPEFDFMAPLAPLEFDFEMDTIPGAFHYRGGDWEKFSEEFETTFKAKFGDFYKDHEEDFEKMMGELHEKMERDMERSFERRELAQIDRVREAREHHGRAREEQEVAMQRMNEMRAQSAADMQMHAKEAHAANKTAMEHAREEMNRSREHMKTAEQHMKRMQEKMTAFEKELKEQLIKDKYIGKDEKIQNIQWEDASIKINEKEIKKADVKKYNELHDKYFEKGGSFQYVE